MGSEYQINQIGDADWYEYVLSDAGRDLYGAILAMLQTRQDDPSELRGLAGRRELRDTRARLREKMRALRAGS